MREFSTTIFNCMQGISNCIYSCLSCLFCCGKCCCGSKVSTESETRQIEVGVVVAGDKKKHNKIKTSKYSLLMFIPQNLSEQFRRVVNFYFLVVTVIAIVIDSPVSPLTSIAPLTFMVFVTAVKQGYEDWLRHKTDNKINNKKVEIVKKNVIQEVKSSSIAPGTLVRVKRGNEVPADLVLLCSASEKGKCYVTTANLDGEANLKTLRVPQPFIGCSADILPQGMRITVNNPEANLYTFQGSLKIPSQPQPLALSPENLMLRGSRVRNTEWAIGCAVYTGEETKLALNSKFTSNKFSSCELAVNAFLIFFIILLIFEMFMSLIAKIIIERRNPERQSYLGPALQYSTQSQQALQDLLSFLLLYYYIIPMSLYVTVELYKFIGSLFIRWDEELRCTETGKPAVANTSDLNEELGQVQVLFSDKTGTLTKNTMVFKACSIKGTVYEERRGGFFDVERPELPPASVSQTDVQFFFSILALCHNVHISDQDVKRLSATLTRESKQMLKLLFRKKKKNLDINETPDLSIVDEGDGRIEYHASSPDEKALVEAADRIGVTFLGEDGSNLLIKIGSRMEMYERLQNIEFTSERRRMSVILRDKDGKIWLFCKGAESAVLPLCKDSVVVEEVNKDIDSFANKGLRTLAVAYREIPQEEYDKICESVQQGEPTSVKELEQMAVRFRELEKEMTLLGATAVEDCLQDGVADTLAALRRAGIKIWVLTGDKVETAINVAQSCAHISENDRRMFMIGVDQDTVQEHLDECKRIVLEQTYTDCALVVDGATMSSILDTPWAAQFAEVSMKCKAVLCCRLSPIQKAKIVKLIKNTPERPITAAIGDGANDISMIQEAHVGFGIFGKEGYQAARCADFAFTQFSMVKRMLLVLGHWYYQRLTTLIHYFFYKNILLGNMMLIFQLHTAFSTQSIYNSMYLTLYNFFFTTLPCLLLSITEQRWPADLLMWNPTLYREISGNRLMSTSHFVTWLLTGCYHSIVIYLFTWLASLNSVVNADGKPIDLWCFGAILFHLTIVIVNLKLWMQARYQTYIFIVSVLATIFIYMAFDVFYSVVNISLDGDSLGVYLRLLSSPSFWLLNLLTIIAALAPDYCARLISDKWGKRSRDMKVIMGPKLFVTQL